jgi:hypothetical protein
MNKKRTFDDEIDNYSDSLFAIIGFVNFYRYDDASGRMRSDVKVFQGRKLTPSPAKQKSSDVTPDLGIMLPNDTGVLGEVKQSFPADQNHWFDCFEQLLSYDDELKGWPCAAEAVKSHDVVLLLHQSRAVAVRKFFEANKDSRISFVRPFCIVEFNRSNQSQAYIFFRTVIGKLTESSVDQRLEIGVQVPMEKLTGTYSAIKIWDSEPPMPFLLALIWEHIINLKASEDVKYPFLRKRQKIVVEITVSEIVDELHTKFSFHQLTPTDDGRQPKIPKSEWVQRACEKLVAVGDAEWINRPQGKLKVRFTRFESVLEHFKELCAGDLLSDAQMTLFKPES